MADKLTITLEEAEKELRESCYSGDIWIWENMVYLLRENERLRIENEYLWRHPVSAQCSKCGVPLLGDRYITEPPNKAAENFQKYYNHYADKHYGEAGFPLDRPCPFCPENSNKESDHVTAGVREYGREIPLTVDVPNVYDVPSKHRDSE